MVRAESLTPTDLLATLWRYRWAAVLLAVLGGPLAYAYSLFLPDQFTANTLVLVQDTATPSNYVRSTVNLDLEARLRTLRDQVLSRTRLQAVMERHDLFRDVDSWEVALKRMRARIDVEVSRTDAFRISFTHTDPVVARDVTNSLARLFIEASAGAVTEQAASTTAMIDEQLESLRSRLDAKEQEIADFKSANMGRLPEQMQANQNALSRLQQQLATNGTALTAARDRQARLEQLAAESPEVGGARRSAREVARQLMATSSGAELDAVLGSRPPIVRLEALRLQRERLLSRYTEKHPDVRVLDVEIAELEKQVGDAGPWLPTVDEAAPANGATVIPDQLAAARREVAALESERADIRAEIAAYEARVEGAPEVEQQLQELERGRQTLARSYDDILSRRMEASLAGDLERRRPTAAFEVIDPAVAPERKSAPTRALFLVFGSVVGLLLGVGGGVARELILQPVHTAEELERHLGVPVLSRIPLIDGAGQRRRQRLARVAATVAVVGVVVGVFVLRLYLRAP